MGKTVKSVFRFLGKTALIISRIFIKAQLPDPCEMLFCGHLDLSSSHLCASVITLNKLELVLPVNPTIFTDWRGRKDFKPPPMGKGLCGDILQLSKSYVSMTFLYLNKTQVFLFLIILSHSPLGKNHRNFKDIFLNIDIIRDNSGLKHTFKSRTEEWDSRTPTDNWVLTKMPELYTQWKKASSTNGVG